MEAEQVEVRVGIMTLFEETQNLENDPLAKRFFPALRAHPYCDV